MPNLYNPHIWLELMDTEQTFVSVPWRPSAESLAPVRLFSVSPFAPVAQRSEAESERLSSVRDSPHPEEDKKGLLLLAYDLAAFGVLHQN